MRPAVALNRPQALTSIDEYSRECLASFVARRIRSEDVIFVLADLFLTHGVPKHIRSDNGPEFVAKNLLAWFATLEVKPLFIQPGSPWENGYCESFNGKMRYFLPSEFKIKRNFLPKRGI